MKRFALPIILIALIVAAVWYDNAVAPSPDNLPPQTAPLAKVEPAKETLEILDFFATWCGPCKAQMPKMLLIEADGYEVTRVNVDKDEARANEYGITSVPTYVVLINGKEKYRTQNAWELADWLKKHERSVQRTKGSVSDVPQTSDQSGASTSKVTGAGTIAADDSVRGAGSPALGTCSLRDRHLYIND